MVLLLCFLPGALSAVTRTWDGGGANELASNRTNWSGDVAPVENDDIVLNATSHKNMTWDLNLAVASWTQSGYTGTVTIATVYPGQGAFTNFTVLGDCDIQSGAWTHNANPNDTYYEVYLLRATIGGNLVIGPAAAINVLGKGYAYRGCGPGRYADTGSHGGRGNNGSSSAWCYGSIVAPTNLGAGGWSMSGGGAVILTVAGETRHDGLISATGGGGYAYYGGAGGTVNIISGTMVGTGAIQANAGSVSGLAHSGGGGGRIALVVTNYGVDFSGYSGLPTAYGVARGGAGTIYMRTAEQGLHKGTLIIDNNINPVDATEIGEYVQDAVVGNVVIRNKGCLSVLAGYTLTLSGDWSNTGTYAGQLGSQIIFAGPPGSVSAIYGSSSFMGLTCTNAGGKILLFESGQANYVPAKGRLTLMGDPAETNLFLRSTSDGEAWNLVVDGTADLSIFCVDVKNSDAQLGAEVVAVNSMDQGRNRNWSFVTAFYGQTNIWTGNSNTVWSAAPNWSLGRPPLADDYIIIPSDRPLYPLLDNNRTVNGLDIQAGASLSLNGYNLAITHGASIAGTISVLNTETIAFYGNADFTGGAFTPAFATIAIAGSSHQTVNLADLEFHKIELLNSSAPITFSGGFTATELRCEAPDGTRTLIFEPGKVVRLRDILLLGSSTSPNIALRSSSPGGGWSLAVSGYRSVRGVDVQDSHAGVGLPVTAISSTDSGNNINWVFGAEWSEWLGTINTDFHTAGNWSSGIVPDSKSRVRVESANPMVISSPATVQEMIVGGGAGQAAVTANALVAVNEDIIVRTNGSLALNKQSLVRQNLHVHGGGILAHSGPQASEVNKLELTVYGDMCVDVNGMVNATAKGYQSSKGPGAGTGASYGGRGWNGYSSIIANGLCYGSLTAPTDLGSGGGWHEGGGAIIMKVVGTIRNDGDIWANGLAMDYCMGSGGSIYLVAGAMTGKGSIQANGGDLWGHSPAGGGRVSVVVTNAGADFSSCLGVVEARSSRNGTSAAGAGAGTVYMQTASDRVGRGTLRIDNRGLSSTGLTDLPPYTNYESGEAARLTVRVSGAARLRLTNDFTMGDIWLDSSNAVLDLSGKTLTVRSREHPLGPGTVLNYGQIIWLPYIPRGTIYGAR